MTPIERIDKLRSEIAAASNRDDTLRLKLHEQMEDWVRSLRVVADELREQEQGRIET